MLASKPITKQLNQWLHKHSLGTLQNLQPLSGGCICENYKLTTLNNEHYFLKFHPEPPATLFDCEQAGLQELAKYTHLRIPRIVAAGKHYLILEYIEPGTPATNFWQQLAEGLAELHAHNFPQFGFDHDNFCGTGKQPNPNRLDGYQFFAEARLLFQGELAFSRQRISRNELTRLEHLVKQLPELIPMQAASLLHGDLWSGNIYCDSLGNPVLIDPACYRGWREADIAMTRLFGALPVQFYEAYHHHLPMQPGWQQRMDIYNLYHLLNHLNLFGDGYHAQVTGVLSRYT